MKKIFTFLMLFGLCNILPQSMSNAFFEELYFNKAMHYSITAVFSDSITAVDAGVFTNLNNWILKSAENKIIKLTSTELNGDSTEVSFTGDFDFSDILYLTFRNKGKYETLKVEAQSDYDSTYIGLGKPLEFSLRRFSEQEIQLAVDYNVKVDLVGKYLYPGASLGVYLQSYNVHLQSHGTFSNSYQVNNGTQTYLCASAIPYIFTGQLIYRNEVSFGYQVETVMIPGSDKVFNVTNKSFRAGLMVEVPYSNYLMYKLHQSTGYVRLAMPLRLKADYLPKGTNQSGVTTSARMDVSAEYELAFSPYLILKGEYFYSKFIDPPLGSTNSFTFTSFTVAQDLKVLGQYLGFLSWLFGIDEVGDKHFIFYKVESGSKAPAFIPVNQQSIGFSIFL